MNLALPARVVALGWFYLGVSLLLCLTQYYLFFYLIILFSPPKQIEESKLSPLIFFFMWLITTLVDVSSWFALNRVSPTMSSSWLF